MDYTFVWRKCRKRRCGGSDRCNIVALYGKKVKTPDNSRIMLITGMAAGFGGLFSDTVGGNFLCNGSNCGRLHGLSGIAPGNTAAFVASFTSHSLGLEKFAVELMKQLIFQMQKQ